MIKLVYYLDVLSSWCHYCEPSLQRVVKKYGPQLSYSWRIALITENMPGGNTLEQIEWYYKRSGSISGTHLNPQWRQGSHTTLDANLAAEAARELGFTDDRVRLALARAAMVEGMPIYHKTVAADVVAAVTGAERERILALMDDATIKERVKHSSSEFASFHIDQRPAFVLHSSIGDTAIFSGIWAFEP
ncbi:MAG TPA: DsbA family protein, partial [Candidatus Eremiobacteraceae bacterium]|nr:DsbA family protein [Candidatus Eremiobacteraceae bacterium]